MTKLIGAALLALALLFGGAATIDPAAAASLQAATREPRTATGVSEPRRVRHYQRYVSRAYYPPHYLDRPYYYAPAPNFALAFGFGFGPWW